MGRPQRKKRTHKNVKDLKKKFRTKRKTKDIDEVHEDIEKKSDSLLHPVSYTHLRAHETLR